MSKLRAKEMIQVSLRLSLLQSSWCEGGMQSIGLAYCLVPGLRRLYPDEPDLTRAMKRYKDPFNTHPFLAGVFTGAVLKLEEDRRSPAEIDAFIHGSMGPMAALADPLFAHALPAFVAVAASLAAIFGGPLAGIITLLVAFNTVHFAVRYCGIYMGFKDGDMVMLKFANWLNPKRTRRLKTLAAAGAGVVLVAVADKFGPVLPIWATVGFGVGLVFAVFGISRWIPAIKALVSMILTALIFPGGAK
jgi:PTS system mannose-specific IID component